MVGIGGIAAKIKEIIQKIRNPIDKAVGKVVGFIVGKAKELIGKISGADKPKEELPKNEAEHDVQVNAGLAALDKEQQREDQDHNGALTEDEAIEAAQKVKAAYSVFKSITPVEQGGRWVFKYVGSEGKLVGLNIEAILGGPYSKVPANGGQVHHIPAKNVSPYTESEGPSIRLETIDHLKTKSWGSSKEAKAYRNEQKELIEQGQFEKAMQMDINDIREQFGNKYDKAIEQMLSYYEQLKIKKPI